MKINFTKLLDWSVEKVEAPKLRHVGRRIAGYVVRVKYVHHGRHSYAFNLPYYCDLYMPWSCPGLDAQKCYDKLKARMDAQKQR